jgi:hypothetical protein
MSTFRVRTSTLPLTRSSPSFIPLRAASNFGASSLLTANTRRVKLQTTDSLQLLGVGGGTLPYEDFGLPLAAGFDGVRWVCHGR